MSTTEYRPMLVCRPESRCVRVYGDDPDWKPEHDVRRPGMEFTSKDEAREHAEGMRTKAYGTEHDIVIKSRNVSDWKVAE